MAALAGTLARSLAKPLARALAAGRGVASPGYPNFPYTTLGTMRTAADIRSGLGFADTAMADSPYGATALQQVIAADAFAIPLQVQSPAVNVTNGCIRIRFKTDKNSTFWASSSTKVYLRLFSAGTPLAPSTSYHQAQINSTIAPMASAMWQTLNFHSSAFTAVLSGANLSAITYAYLYFDYISGAAATVAVGDIDFVPNPRTKAAVILRMDDATESANSIVRPELEPYGFKICLAPGAVASAQGYDGFGRLTKAEVAVLLDATGLNYQELSQSWTTEAPSDTSVGAFIVEHLGARAYFLSNFGTRAYQDSADGTFYSNIGFSHVNFNAAVRNTIYRTLMRFENGNVAASYTGAAEQFPFSDRFNVRCLNLASQADQTNTFAMVDQILQYAVQFNGCAIVACHDVALASKELAAIQRIRDYVLANPTLIEWTTVRDSLAPHLAAYGAMPLGVPG